MSSTEKTLSGIVKLIIKSNQRIDNNFSIIAKKVEAMDKKVKNIDNKVSALTKTSKNKFGTVGKTLDEIKTDLKKIQKVSVSIYQFTPIE